MQLMQQLTSTLKCPIGNGNSADEFQIKALEDGPGLFAGESSIFELSIDRRGELNLGEFGDIELSRHLNNGYPCRGESADGREDGLAIGIRVRLLYQQLDKDGCV